LTTKEVGVIVRTLLSWYVEKEFLKAEKKA
jgi:hypothetical protein